MSQLLFASLASRPATIFALQKVTEPMRRLLATKKMHPSFDECIFLVGKPGILWNHIRRELIAMSEIVQSLRHINSLVAKPLG